jgi:hypothetical protein
MGFFPWITKNPRLLDINLLLNFTVKNSILNIDMVKFPTKNVARDIMILMEVYLVMEAKILSYSIPSSFEFFNTSICCMSWPNSHTGVAPSESHNMIASLHVKIGSL